MDSSTLSISVFGIYLIFVGAGFLFIPNVLLSFFKFSRTSEPWIKVVGVLILIIALFYLVAAYNSLTVIYWTTIFGRSFVLLSFAALVLAKKAHRNLLLFGVIDALGAVWTLITLL